MIYLPYSSHPTHFIRRYGTVTFPRYSQPVALCNATAPNGTTPIPFSFCNIAFTMGPRDAVVCAYLTFLRSPTRIIQGTHLILDLVTTSYYYTGLGCTPPPAAYFSIRSYVAFRFKPSVWFPAAELGDPANFLTLNSTGGPEDPFSKTALMISTGDAETVGGWVYMRVCMLALAPTPVPILARVPI